MNEIQETVIKEMNKLETELATSVGATIDYSEDLETGTFLTDRYLCLIEMDTDFEFADIQIYDITNGTENVMEITSFTMDNPGNKMSILDVFENVMDEYAEGFEELAFNLYSYEDGKKLFEIEASSAEPHKFSSSGLLGIPDAVFTHENESEDEDEV